MFSNLKWPEILLLLLLALFIFGDRLPHAIGDRLRMLRNLRRMAQSATTDLSRELGTDIRLEDLHPRTFVRKHLLSEADQEALLKPLKGVSDDVAKHTRGVGRDLEDVAGEVQEATGRRRGSSRPGRSAQADGAVASGITPPAPTPGGEPAPTAEPAPPRETSYDDVT